MEFTIVPREDGFSILAIGSPPSDPIVREKVWRLLLNWKTNYARTFDTLEEAETTVKELQSLIGAL